MGRAGHQLAQLPSHALHKRWLQSRGGRVCIWEAGRRAAMSSGGHGGWLHRRAGQRRGGRQQAGVGAEVDVVGHQLAQLEPGLGLLRSEAPQRGLVSQQERQGDGRVDAGGLRGEAGRGREVGRLPFRPLNAKRWGRSSSCSSKAKRRTSPAHALRHTHVPPWQPRPPPCPVHAAASSLLGACQAQQAVGPPPAPRGTRPAAPRPPPPPPRPAPRPRTRWWPRTARWRWPPQRARAAPAPTLARPPPSR